MSRLRTCMTFAALCVFISAASSSSAPLVSSGQVFPGTWAGAAAWGDYDNDGDPDLVMTGGIVTEDGPRRIAWVYRNDGGILEKAQELTGVYHGAVAWGDYDNDGDLDLALSGWADGDVEVTKVYRNGGDGTLKEEVELDGLRYSALAWGDYDDDGDLDLVASGMEHTGFVQTYLYRNDERQFVEDEENSESLVDVHKGALAWGDYDDDGDLDLALSGIGTIGTRFGRIYRNDEGKLDRDRDIELMKVSGGALAWGDYDDNGTLDLALSGWDEHWKSRLILYRNGPPGVLQEDRLSFFRPVAALAWGDYDNDGDLDLAASGATSVSTMQAFVLDDLPESGSMETSELIPLRGGALAWGDYDGDGDLDLFASGEDGRGGRSSLLYTNEEEAYNTEPSQPGLPGTPPIVTNDRVIFRWKAGEDAETRGGLTYTLRVGTEEGWGDVFSGTSTVGPGNVGAQTIKALRLPLAQDTYYWSVRTVDAGFRGSEWPADQMFIVRRFVDSAQNLRDLRNSSAAWGDYDNDGDPDLVLAGHNIDGNPRTLLYRNTDGVLSEKTGMGLRGLPERSAAVRATLAWEDYDNDGDLDLALAGVGTDRVFLYQNAPTGSIALNSTASAAFEQLRHVTIAWGDYDNDGAPDLALMGLNEEVTTVMAVYRNTPEGFVESHRIPGMANGSIAWGDYDNDGDLDLAISGDAATSGKLTGRFTKIYRNDPLGTLFEDTGQSLTGVISSALAWGDYDNDGDLDLALAGIDPTGEVRTLIYENNPVGRLTERFALDGVKAGSLAWGDYDNDGDADLVVIGNDRDDRPMLKVYRNEAPVAFEEEIYRKLVGVDWGTVFWCDIDRDGDLDLFTAGRERAEDSFPRSVVNDNLEGRFNPNHPPDPPRGLSALPEGSDVLLEWEFGVDRETPSEGLAYTLRVGTSSRSNDILSGAVGLGAANVGQGTSHRLTGLESGTYYWSVQALDPGLARSAWSEEGWFIIDTVEPVVIDWDVTPNRAGIDQVVTVAINFHDEHTQIDTDVSPVVIFSPAGASISVPVAEFNYEGVTWTGTVTIADTISSGGARLSVSGARDGRGNEMAEWTREGAFDVDTAVPVVIRKQPESGQIGVARTPRIEVAFSEPLQSSTILEERLVHLMLEDERVRGDLIYDPATWTVLFTPSEALSPRTEYEVIVSAQIQDLVGNRMDGDARWRFETAPVVEARFGGTVANESSTVRLYIAPNALAVDQEVSLTESMEVDTPPDAGARFAGVAFRFDPDTTSLKKPCALTIAYREIGLLGDIEESKLALWRSGDTWTRLGGTVDVEAGRIVTSVETLGTFALFEDAPPQVGEFGLMDVKLTPRVFSPRGFTSTASAAKLAGALPSETSISFELPRGTAVTIEIYNESGRLERVLAEERSMSMGRATVAWDGRDDDGDVVASGLYIAVIRTGDLQQQKTVAVLNQ